MLIYSIHRPYSCTIAHKFDEPAVTDGCADRTLLSVVASTEKAPKTTTIAATRVVVVAAA